MTQPVWRCVANLGDADPLVYGGCFVFVDETGENEPQMERVFPADECGGEKHDIYRVRLDKCTLIDWILSDNKFYPDKAAWFAPSVAQIALHPQDSKLADVCKWCDVTEVVMLANFCSDNPIDRAIAYREIYEFHGWANGGGYPLSLATEECVARYADILDRFGGFKLP